MKIKVTCACGSSFQAPENLAGQVIRCPACRKPLKVPALPADSTAPRQPPAAPPQMPPPAEPVVDLNDLSALDQVSLDSSTMHGSTAGRSAIRQAPKRRKKSSSSESTVSDQAISQEMDDRMTRLYEVYAGQKMTIAGPGRGNRLKLCIGLGIAAAAIGLGLFVAWNVFQSEYGGLDALSGGAVAQRDAQADDEAALNGGGDRAQDVDASAVWQAPDASQVSGVVLAGVQVTTGAGEDERFDFTVTLTPASRQSDRRLSMATAVALYRADGADGPFKQIDRARVKGFDSGANTLSFDLYDATLDGIAGNSAHYRLAGFDSDGKRLFDTPAAAFPILPEPSLSQGRVAWNLRAADKPVPAMRVHARLDASGWEDVYLWRAAANGPIDAPLPQLSAGLPVVIESAVYTPTGISLDARGAGRWNMQWISRVLQGNSASDAPVVGAAPHIEADGIGYRLIPDESRFTTVTRSAAWNPGDPRDPAGQARTVTFAAPGSATQTMSATAPPSLSNVTATAYDGRVHLGWDSAALVAGLDRYADPVQIEVRRVDAIGNIKPIATLPADSTGYTDTDISTDQPNAYEVALVSAGAGGADPLLIADAWIEGIGVLAVQVPCPWAHLAAPVTPGPGLDRLYVSLGIPELSYDGTGLPAAQLQQRLTEALVNTPNVAVVDRAALRCFVGADAGTILASSTRRADGAPAQVLLRLVDSTGPQGDSLSLWVTDLADGRSHRIATAPAEHAVEQTDLFVTALQTCLSSRRPAGLTQTTPQTTQPQTVLIGPIYPVDQPIMFYRTHELADQLAKAGDLAHPDLAVVTRRFWLDDTRQTPGAIEPGALRDTVLIVGRAWSADASLPGVSLHAVDPVTGRLIDRFTSDRLSPEAVRGFVQWCGELRVPSADLPAEASPLQAAEGEAHVLAFGVPMPMALDATADVRMRDPDHPLYAIRPCVGPQHPLMFDRWARLYADYIEADCAAFMAGFEQISRIQQASPGPIRPQLLIRGQRRFTGTDTIPPTAGGLRMTPAGLNMRTYFPMGAAGQPMIDYHSELSQAFRGRPWTMSHAWKQVSDPVADAFLKAELFGVEDGRLGRLAMPTTPVSLTRYITADLLAEIGNREAHNFRQRALQIASGALQELVNLDTGRRLTPEQLRWATDSLLVLVYEQDPGAIQNLKDDAFRDRYFSVDPDIQTDVLRMLVDRAGPEAWGWLDEFDSVGWPAFVWRSTQELDSVTKTYVSAIPRDSLEDLRAWLDTPDMPADGPDVISATGPAPGPRPN